MIKEKGKFVEKSHNKFRQIAKDFIAVCPKCKSIHIAVRNRKTPKYRCASCHNEFDDPNAQIAYTSQKQKHDYGQQYFNPDE